MSNVSQNDISVVLFARNKVEMFQTVAPALGEMNKAPAVIWKLTINSELAFILVLMSMLWETSFAAAQVLLKLLDLLEFCTYAAKEDKDVAAVNSRVELQHSDMLQDGEKGCFS